MKNGGTIYDHTPGLCKNGSSLDLSTVEHMPHAPSNPYLPFFIFFDKKNNGTENITKNVLLFDRKYSSIQINITVFIQNLLQSRFPSRCFTETQRLTPFEEASDAGKKKITFNRKKP